MLTPKIHDFSSRNKITKKFAIPLISFYTPKNLHWIILLQDIHGIVEVIGYGCSTIQKFVDFVWIWLLIDQNVWNVYIHKFCQTSIIALPRGWMHFKSENSPTGFIHMRESWVTHGTCKAILEWAIKDSV